MANPLKSYLTPVTFDLGKQIFLKISPATQFGFLGQADGSVERVKGTPQIHVPVHDWQAAHIDENDVVAQALITAAEASPLKLGSPADVKPSLWAQLRGTTALMINPSLFGKFKLPMRMGVIKHEAVPDNRVIVLGPANLTGYFVMQGARRNVLAHDKQGLTSLQFYMT